MKKQRHLSNEQLKEKLRIDSLVAQEFRRQRSEANLEQEVINAIKATHTTDITLQLIVLIDKYHADKEWCNEFIGYQRELLEQYEAQKVDLKEMKNHIKLAIGMDVEKFTDSIMEFAGIERKKDGSDQDGGSSSGDDCSNRGGDPCEHITGVVDQGGI